MGNKNLRELCEIALLAVLITISGSLKLPSFIPGTEFQLSAPIAVAVCCVFGVKKYLIAGIISSMLGLMLGTQNVLNVMIAMNFRVVVGLVYIVWGGSRFTQLVSGPLGTICARLTLSLFIGEAAYPLLLAAVPGMIFTVIAAPVITAVLTRASKITAARTV